jgi:hypothetical protein
MIEMKEAKYEYSKQATKIVLLLRSEPFSVNGAT